MSATMVPNPPTTAEALRTRAQATLSFEPSQDWELIKQIVSHPKVYPFVSDDFSPHAENWQPVRSNAARYIIVRDEEEVLGLWAFYAHNSICWQVHTCLLPIAYGECARQAAKQMAQWIWNNTPCLRLITEVPEPNRLALRFAKQAGMTQFGFNPDSFQKGGKLYGVHLLGMSKGATN